MGDLLIMPRSFSKDYDFLHWSKLPRVVCGCPTFGRPMRLLNEAVESFLVQDYAGEKELIILNDCNLIKLKYDHPNVKIVNHPTRYKSLGHKFNAMMGIGEYDVWAYWNDDDIYLPHAISTAIENMVNHEFYVPSARFFVLGNKIVRINLQALGSPWVTTHKFWKILNGYKNNIIGIDYDFCSRGRQKISQWTNDGMNPRHIYFMYRWGTGSYHASSMGPTPEHYDNIGKKIFDTVEAGTYEIEPNWDNNYVGMVSEYLQDGGQS